MHIVFLCGGYYPKFSATGNCINNIASSFVERGFKVTVICKNNGNYGRSENYNSQSIIRVNSPYSDFLVKGGTGIFFWLKSLFWKFYIFASPAGLNRGLVKNFEKALIELNRDSKIDALIPCCMPAESIDSSVRFAKKTPGLILFPCLYDLFSENALFFGNRFLYRLKKNNAKAIEKQIFSLSRKVFYIDNWESYFHKNRINNGIRVEHPLLIRKNNGPNPRPLHGDAHSIKLIYQGELNFQNRPPYGMMACFDAVSKMNDHKLSLHIFAGGNASGYVEKKCDGRDSFFYGRVEKSVADGYFSSADVALIIANKDPAIVPSKIFECIAYGYPIIYFYNDTNEKAFNILKRYPLVFFIDQKGYSFPVDKLLEWIVCSFDKRVTFEQAKQLFPDAVPDYLVQIVIDELGLR